MAKSYKGLLAVYGDPVHGYIKSLNKGVFLGKVERQGAYVLTHGVQVELSKRQSWPRHWKGEVIQRKKNHYFQSQWRFQSRSKPLLKQ